MANALQGRTFGLPNVVLIGGAAVLIWFLFLRGKAAGAKPAAGTSPSGQATTDYSLGYSQGLQSAGVQGQAQATPAAQQRGTVSGTQGGTDLWATPGQQQHLQFLPDGTGFIVLGPPVSGQTISADPHGSSPLWLNVRTDSGQAGYIWLPDAIIRSVGGALGGPVRKFHSGSRSANLWHDSHPLVGAPVSLPHYVRKVSGPAGGSMRHHQAEVHRVARQAGVHPARVMMLNPRPSSPFIRVA